MVLSVFFFTEKGWRLYKTAVLAGNFKEPEPPTCDRLAQLREVVDFKPRPDQHSGSLNN